MNLILLDSSETRQTWPIDDPRSRHVLEILRFGTGDRLDVGLAKGPRGKAQIVATSPVIELELSWETEVPSPRPLHLAIGLPRPQLARRLLQSATTFGVTSLHFYQAERGEPSYAQATLWRSEEWKRHLREGAEQAFATWIPDVVHHADIATFLAARGGSPWYALDNYEANGPLAEAELQDQPAGLILGPERGFTSREREALRADGVGLWHLGERVLKTDQAALCGLAVLATRLGLW